MKEKNLASRDSNVYRNARDARNQTERDPPPVCARASRSPNVKHVRYVRQFPCGNVSGDQSCGKSDGRYGLSTGLFDDRPKRALTFAYVRQGASRDVSREEKGKPETLFSYSCAERSAPSLTSNRSKPKATDALGSEYKIPKYPNTKFEGASARITSSQDIKGVYCRKNRANLEFSGNLFVILENQGFSRDFVELREILGKL